MTAEQNGLSEHDYDLLRGVLGEWWSNFFHYAGPERDKHLKALLDAARAERASDHIVGVNEMVSPSLLEAGDLEWLATVKAEACHEPAVTVCKRCQFNARIDRILSSLRGQGSSSPTVTERDVELWAELSDWIGFSASVIKSGEPWTETCGDRYSKAKQAFYALLPAAAPPVSTGGSDYSSLRAQEPFASPTNMDASRQSGEGDWAILEQVVETNAPFVAMLHYLRQDEGDSVTLLCDNPDFNGQPNNAIECNGAWTNWTDVRYAGGTIEAAVREAYVAKRGSKTDSGSVA